MRTRRIVVAATMFAILVIGSGISWADNGFDDRSLRGTWGFSAAGTVGGAPATAVGLLKFFGNGTCRTVARLNVGGTVAALTSNTCDFTVNNDGTGAITSTFPGLPQTFTTDFVIIDRKEFHFIISDNLGATVASGVAKRQDD